MRFISRPTAHMPGKNSRNRSEKEAARVPSTCSSGRTLAAQLDFSFLLGFAHVLRSIQGDYAISCLSGVFAEVSPCGAGLGRFGGLGSPNSALTIRIAWSIALATSCEELERCVLGVFGALEPLMFAKDRFLLFSRTQGGISCSATSNPCGAASSVANKDCRLAPSLFFEGVHPMDRQ